jgi:hypothetical protein
MTGAARRLIANTTRPQTGFDTSARHIAEVIDDAIMLTERPRERRLQLIAHHIRRAILHGYKAARRARAAGP